MSNTSNTSNDFLPTGYTVPNSTSGYMKLEQGDNKFRPMGSPVMGQEFWIDTKGDDGKPKREPVRRRIGENIDVGELTDPEGRIKHFWAFVVWNYNSNSLQVLEITQKTIMKSITNLTKDEDWGSPVGNEGYDIVINKTGEKMETEYSVIAKPKKKLTPEIMKAYDTTTVNLEALFSNDDPFKVGGGKELNIDNFDPDSMD